MLPVISNAYTPVRVTPVRVTPVRVTPVRVTPVRVTPVRASTPPPAIKSPPVVHSDNSFFTYLMFWNIFRSKHVASSTKN
jgi:hypothetical protein